MCYFCLNIFERCESTVTELTKQQRISFEKQLALGIVKMLFNQNLLSKEEYDNCVADIEKDFVFA